jgi:hypothetical protein
MRRIVMTSNILHNTKIKSFLGLLLCSAAMLIARCEAIDTTDARPIYFGAVGLANLQVARLNVVNIGDPTITPPGPCRVGLSFLDDQGVIVNYRNGRPAATELDLPKGVSRSLDMSAAAIIIDGVRRQFRGLVVLPPPPTNGSADPCANVIPTLEIFEQRTGRTTLFLHPALIRGFDPQPDPPGAPVLLQ